VSVGNYVLDHAMTPLHDRRGGQAPD